MRRVVSVSAPAAPWVLAVGVAWLATSAVACLQNVSTGTGTTDPATTTTTSSNAVPSGTGCTTDSKSQITLCDESSVCPKLDVNQSIFPGCGFRLRPGAVIDLECTCADSLCPIGVADSCSQALQLLSSQTSLSVCQQESNGRCVSLGASDAGTRGTGTAATSSPCDKPCEAACAGEPSCLQLCGC